MELLRRSKRMDVTAPAVAEAIETNRSPGRFGPVVDSLKQRHFIMMCLALAARSV